MELALAVLVLLVDRDGGHHDLPDHVARLGERVIRPIGRRDGAGMAARGARNL